LDCILEAEGIDGETRQIVYLGEIAETEISDVATQCGFWERVTRILDDLSDGISAGDRQAIEEASLKRCRAQPRSNTVYGRRKPRRTRSGFGDACPLALAANA
jgi:hypothetical protein